MHSMRAEQTGVFKSWLISAARRLAGWVYREPLYSRKYNETHGFSTIIRALWTQVIAGTTSAFYHSAGMTVELAYWKTRTHSSYA